MFHSLWCEQKSFLKKTSMPFKNQKKHSKTQKDLTISTNLNSLQNDHSPFPTCDTQQGASSSSYTKLQTKFHSASRSLLKRLGPKTRLLRMDHLNISILKRKAAEMFMLMLNLFAPVHFFSLQFYNYSMEARMFKVATKRIAYNLQHSS